MGLLLEAACVSELAFVVGSAVLKVSAVLFKSIIHWRVVFTVNLLCPDLKQYFSFLYSLLLESKFIFI